MSGLMIEAASKSTSGSSSSSFFLIIVVLFVVLYFIVIRPRQKRATAQRQQMSDLRVGDEILTAGGVYGHVTSLDDDSVQVAIAPTVEVRVARRAVAAIITEHTEADTPEEPAEEGDDEKWKSAFHDDPGGDNPG